MTACILGRLLLIGAILALPVMGHAQEAVISGTVMDTTGGVLPGVTVTALHEATGNTFLTVTDGNGSFRIPARIGGYRITLELPGFTTVTRSGLNLLVGQTATLTLQMAPSGVEETVTVTGEAPLLDTRQSIVGGNLDSRQLSEIPVSGRNFVDLVMLAPGARTNEVGDVSGPVPQAGRTGSHGQGNYQLNLDGQQVTTTMAGTLNNASFSREAIAEFQVIANRFDATQGRSMGLQVNAITKSGSNTPSGTFSGYFRDDSLNAADFIRGEVLPFSNQQVAVTYGGPIRIDKVHIFSHYEYEREPRTIAFTTPYPTFNIDLKRTVSQHKAGGRLDADLGSQRRFTVSGNFWNRFLPNRFDLNRATDHPSSATSESSRMVQLSASLTQVFGNRAVNVLRGGVFRQTNDERSHIGNETQGKIHLLGGLSIGPGLTTAGRTPFRWNPTYYSIRNDFTYSFAAGGRHDLKVGGEYLYNTITDLFWCNFCRGYLDARGGPVPANIEELFPVWNDPSTWNVAALSPIAVRYQQAVGQFDMRETSHLPGAWVQDDWAVTPRLTLNVGVRWDMHVGAFAENLNFSIPPFLPPNRASDKGNVAPRLGFAYSLTDRTVARGGWGKYYAQMFHRDAFYSHAFARSVIPETRNDGRPDFASNPFNGPAPTFDDVVARSCHVIGVVPGCVRNDLTRINSPSTNLPYAYQTSVGVQQQLGDTTAVTADYVYNGQRNVEIQRNINLTYNPATGANYPFSDISRRAFPEWGVVNVMRFSEEGLRNYHGLETSFTKRFSQGWQLAGTYTLAGLWDADPRPVSASINPTTGVVQYLPLPFETAPDLGGEYGLGVTDQRHRATLNGIWQLPYRFQVSGLYFYGSGVRFATPFGGDTRNLGAGGENRLRPDGTVAPRNNFVSRPLHRVDVRLLRRFPLGGRVAIDGILEVFNLLNHENYGNYVTTQGARNFGQPVAHDNVAYQPRQMQLGFRATF